MASAQPKFNRGDRVTLTLPDGTTVYGCTVILANKKTAWVQPVSGRRDALGGLWVSTGRLANA